ncbi:MAG TPA: hypothetical protein VMX55_04995 [candidate division Zixibacteria bacterium]|nr:hypothetical protein [candidate division Zixibacteria bacterium]
MKLELVNEPLRATQTAILIDLEDTMITVGKKSKIFPVIDSRNYENIGYYVIGDIYLGADTIVNTDKGAVGEPIEKLAREAFIKCEEIDFTNTKSDDISDKEFKSIEIKAYRYFEKMYKSNFNHRGKFTLNGKNYDWQRGIEKLDFYTYLFDPQEFILIKDEETIIALDNMERDIIVCNKKKNSYVEVSKENGVKVHDHKGQAINVGSSGGIMINGKNLSDILSSALKPLSDMFSRNRF